MIELFRNHPGDSVKSPYFCKKLFETIKHNDADNVSSKFYFKLPYNIQTIVHMKKILLSLALGFSFVGLSAQTDLSFNIDHKLGTEAFSFETSLNSNQNIPLEVTRLDYYISEITLVHDGGQETPIINEFILANAGIPVNLEIGNHPVNTLEKVRFYIGVPEAFNHLDPALYPDNHPLAYQMPSMHWGWALGYKFLTIEGNAGSGLANNYQIHTTGDSNYTMVEVTINESASNGRIDIALNADYLGIFEDISIANGLFNHGEFAEAKTAIENMSFFVFSKGEAISSTSNLNFEGSFSAYPNPAGAGMMNIKADMLKDGNYNLSVKNLLGQTIESYTFQTAQLNYQIQTTEKGLFIVELADNTGSLVSEKIVLQ